MDDLPSGTVTFAFTDIEGSTVLLKRLGDGYADVLATHRRLVRAAFARHDGVEIDTQGDAFFFAFVRARDAVAAAAEVQRDHVDYSWPNGVQVRMRVGLHTGEPTLGEEGYLGLDVVRAARLCGECRGGQVLLSETTRALVSSQLPSGVSLFPLGERHLKDIDEPERVYELEIEGMEQPPPEAEPAQQATPDDLSPSESKRSEKEWEEDFERRVENLVRRGMEGMLEWGAGKFGRSEPAGGFDDIAAHADELTKRIERKLRQAQKKAHDDGNG